MADFFYCAIKSCSSCSVLIFQQTLHDPAAAPAAPGGGKNKLEWMERVVSSSVTRYVGIFGAYIVYLLVGSSIFDAIEIPAVHERQKL